MKVFLGSDHAGFKLKGVIKDYLRELKYEPVDEGAFKLKPDDDYPDFVEIVAQMVAANPESRGIVFGGSGQGEAMCANRFKHIRAVVYYGSSDEIIRLSRAHNNANVLSIGARFVDEDTAKRVVKAWLEEPFSGDDRHIRRLAKLDYNLKDELTF